MALILRKLEEADASKIISWLKSERDVLAWGGPYFDYPLTIADIKALIAEHEGEKPSRECWALDLPDHQFIGTFQLAYNFRSGQAGLARVLIDPGQREKGLAKELLQLAENEAFLRPEINRLELRVFTFNKPAIAAYERAGFITEGTARQSARIGTEYWDTLMMSKLRSER